MHFSTGALFARKRMRLFFGARFGLGMTLRGFRFRHFVAGRACGALRRRRLRRSTFLQRGFGDVRRVFGGFALRFAFFYLVVQRIDRGRRCPCCAASIALLGLNRGAARRALLLLAFDRGGICAELGCVLPCGVNASARLLQRCFILRSLRFQLATCVRFKTAFAASASMAACASCASSSPRRSASRFSSASIVSNARAASAAFAARRGASVRSARAAWLGILAFGFGVFPSLLRLGEFLLRSRPIPCALFAAAFLCSSRAAAGCGAAAARTKPSQRHRSPSMETSRTPGPAA